MQVPKSSADFLAANVARLSEKVPEARLRAQSKGVKRSTWYTIVGKEKSPTLDTIDKLAETFEAPAWLLLHPDMKAWDQNRAWVVHMIETYLAADDEHKEHIRGAIRLVDKSLGRLVDEFGNVEVPAEPAKQGARAGRKVLGVVEGQPERRNYEPVKAKK